MNAHFATIRQTNKRLYVNKDFRNTAFEQAMLIGQEYLQKRFKLTEVPSSHFCRVYKLTVPFNNVETGIYLKQHLSRGILDVIKHIIYPSRAKRAFNASIMLQENGFEAPAVIALLEYRRGIFCTENILITKEIENAKPILESMTDSCRNDNQPLNCRRELLESFGRTIGRMHAKGISHGDMRLGNVLAGREKNIWRFFFLDNERTRIFRRLPARLRVKNLVQLQISVQATVSNTDRMRFYKKYAAENPMSKTEKRTLTNKVIKTTFRRLYDRAELGNRSNKYLQTNKRFLRIEKGRFLAVFDKNLCDRAEPFDFIEKIDALMDNGKIIKSDITTYLSLLSWNNKWLVIKRYNHKGLFHSLCHTIKRSRARRCWLNGHLLEMLNIATPKPLAFIEEYHGPLLWKSYLVTEYVEGQNFYHYWRNKTIDDEKKARTREQILVLLERLGKYLISHGDMKHSNILITSGGPVLTDLDGLKIHRHRMLYERSNAKDLKIFQMFFSK